MIIGLRIEVH